MAMRASIKTTLAGVLTATALAVATIGGAAPASAHMFHGGGGFGHGFAGRGFGGFGHGFAGRGFGRGFGHGFAGRGYARGYGGYGGYGGYYGGYYCDPYWLLINPLMCM
jgi:hypothetical protein